MKLHVPFNLGLLRHERARATVEVADVVLQENVHLGQVGALLGNQPPRQRTVVNLMSDGCEFVRPSSVKIPLISR